VLTLNWGCTISLKAAVLPGHQRTGPSEEEEEEEEEEDDDDEDEDEELDD
jgi:hypothetical protein